MLGVGTDDAVVKICVLPGATTPVAEEDLDECPVCLEPLCDMDSTLLCGHKFHTYCFDKVRRSWAGDGGDFKFDWAERSACDVLICSLMTIHVQRKNKGSKKAREWATRRITVHANDKTGAADILETLIRKHAQAILDYKSANAKPFDAGSFFFAWSVATARALPLSSW